MKKEKQLSELLNELDHVVSRLETEEVTLEDSFNLYKKGVETAQICYEKLRLVEQQIKVITEDKNGFKETILSKDAEDVSVSKIINKDEKKEEKTRKSVKDQPYAKEDGERTIFPGLFECKEADN